MNFKMILSKILYVDDWCYVYIDASSQHTRSGSLLPPIQISTSLTFNRLASTPSLNCYDSEPINIKRRNSSHILLSFEVESCGNTDSEFDSCKDSCQKFVICGYRNFGINFWVLKITFEKLLVKCLTV